MFRKWLKRFSFTSVALFLIWIIALVVLMHHTGTVDQRQPADVIIVLGAGLDHTGRPGYALARRSIHAAELWHEGYAPLIICTGGISETQTRSEAAGCQQVLERRGVPASAILLEEASRSTEENAIYSREIMQANNLESILLVSDSFHMFRARYIFNHYGMTDIALSPIPRERIRGRASYEFFVGREIIAFHWQLFIDFLDLQITHFP